MKRAIRRKHRNRIIKKFQRIYKNWDYENWEVNGKLTAARGSIGCGCCICSNPRRKRNWEYPLTRKEVEILYYLHHWEDEY